MVKKFLLCGALCAVALARGGFVGEGDIDYRGKYDPNFIKHDGDTYRAVSVKEAKKMRDDAHVALIGNITKHIRGDKYLFVDKNGNDIVVEIDDDDWNGLEVTPNTRVRLVGEVDRDFGKVEIDVDDVLPIR